MWSLNENDLRALDMDGLSELLENFDDGKSLSPDQMRIIESCLGEHDDEDEDEDEDDGFVVDPSTPKATKKRHSLNETVTYSESCCSEAGAPTFDESPTLSTISGVHRYAESEFSDTSDFSTIAPKSSSHGGSSSPAVDSLDHELDSKRRAKAANDAAEFARALLWVLDVVGAPAPPDLESRPEDCFGETLKDGVLLCNLINKMSPGTIKSFKAKATMPFHQMANITSFLRGCQTLGVKKRDCFDTVDLQQLKDLSKVYETLLMLSNSVEKTKQTHFAGPYLYSAKRHQAKLRKQRASSSSSVYEDVSSPRCEAATHVAPPTSYSNKPYSSSTLSSQSFENGGISHASSVSETTADEDAFSRSPSVVLKAKHAASQEEENMSLDTLIKTVGLKDYTTQLGEIAGDVNDLLEMTTGDFDDFIASTKMPTLKARRFKTALQKLGANI